MDEVSLTLRIEMPPELQMFIARVTRWLDRQEADAILADAAPEAAPVNEAASPATEPTDLVPPPVGAQMPVEPPEPPVAEAAVPPKRTLHPNRTKRTDARRAVIAREWPLGTPTVDILRMVNDLPGAPFSQTDVAVLANELGKKRPPGYNPKRGAIRHADSARTPERLAVLKREWPKGTQSIDLLPMLNVLPGPPLTPVSMCDFAKDHALRRPEGFVTQRRPRTPRVAAASPVSPAPIEAPSAAIVEPPASIPARPQAAPPAPAPVPPPKVAAPPKPAPKIAAYVPPARSSTPLPRIPTPAERKRAEEAVMIQQHIAQKGVTRCATAVCAPTTAKPAPADAAALRAYTDRQRDAAQAEVQERVDRIARSRAAKLSGKPLAGLGRTARV